MAIISHDHATTLALKGFSYILTQDDLRERFLTLTGLSGDDLRASIGDQGFQSSVLEFFIQHEPDLIDLSSAIDEKPESLVAAWRVLGGGVGQEW